MLIVIDGFSVFLSRTISQRSRHSGSLRHTGSREIAILQCAGLPGGGTPLSGSGFTVIMNVAKRRAPMMNVTTLKISFMVAPSHFSIAGSLWSQRSSHSGLFEPRGTSTVLKEPGVRDRATWSVIP